MTRDQEKIIRDIVERNREIANRLRLQDQALMAMLPERKRRRTVDPHKGYITLPDGEKLWYDKKEEKKYNRAKSGLTLKVTKRRPDNVEHFGVS